MNEIPVIICGDFNSNKNEIVDHLLLTGKIASNYHETLMDDQSLRVINDKIFVNQNKPEYSHRFQFRDSYDWIEHKLRYSQCLTFAARDVRGVVDFIYFTDNNIELVHCNKTVPESMMKKDNSKCNNPHEDQDKELSNELVEQCPNGLMVSDHLPVAAMYQLK